MKSQIASVKSAAIVTVDVIGAIVKFLTSRQASKFYRWNWNNLIEVIRFIVGICIMIFTICKEVSRMLDQYVLECQLPADPWESEPMSCALPTEELQVIPTTEPAETEPQAIALLPEFAQSLQDKAEVGDTLATEFVSYWSKPNSPAIRISSPWKSREREVFSVA